MNKRFTVNEIEEMKVEFLEKIMEAQEVERMHKLGFADFNSFLDMLKDSVVLSGLEDNDEYLTIDEYLTKLEKEQNEQEESIISGETTETTETTEITVAQNNSIGFSGLPANNNIVKPQMITNIEDKKEIFNLGKHVDKKINDCEGQVITIDKVLIKKWIKPLENPIIDEETGEIITDTKTSMSTVIVDKDGTSYVTGSKVFGYQLLNCIFDFGDEVKGLKIKIIKIKRNGSKNASLDFELV